MFKKGLKGKIWVGNGFKIPIIDQNKDILKKQGADVFAKSKKKSEDEDNK